MGEEMNGDPDVTLGGIHLYETGHNERWRYLITSDANPWAYVSPSVLRELADAIEEYEDGDDDD